MVFFNKGEGGYEKFAPQGLYAKPSCCGDAKSVECDGLYNLSPERELSAISSVTDYQYWVESNWKKPHGTFEAVKRFYSKLSEEIDELFEADYEFNEDGCDTKAIELLSELGDVLWCATALASNSSADIDKGIKECLYHYTVGVTNYVDGEESELSWRDNSAEISTIRKNVDFADIDNLMSNGFEPLISRAMNLFDEYPEMDIYEHIDLIKMHSMVIKSIASQQYNYGEDDVFVSSRTYDVMSDDIGIATAEVLLNVAYIAKNRLGLALGDVVNKNIDKTSKRAELGLIDKSDGERPDDLL